MAKSNVRPIPEIVKDLIAYDPETGFLTWKVNRRGTANAGSIAGSVTKDGYIYVRVGQKQYPGHRIAWFLHYGQQPEGNLDHRDNNPANNRINNLRLATSKENNQNVGKTSRNTSGVKNVYWNQNAWIVRLRVNGKITYFGRFQNLFEAREHAIEMRGLHHGEFANHGDSRFVLY